MTKKKCLSIMTSMICTASVFAGGVQLLTANAETYSEKMQYGDYLYYKQVDEDEDGIYDYIEITDCDESATEVEIPSEIYGLSVTSIGQVAFSSCENLTSIEIPDNIISISESAFVYCTNLISIDV